MWRRQGSSRDYHSGGGQQPQPGRGYKDVTDQITDELGTLRSVAGGRGVELSKYGHGSAIIFRRALLYNY